MSQTLLETWRGVAYPAELDHMGHMNVQYYTAKFDQGSWHLFAHVGISNSYLQGHNRAMAAVEQHTHYLAEVMAGDVLVVKSALLEIKEKLIRFRHHMYNAQTGTEAANTEIVALHLDLATRKSCPFPAGIVENCRAFIESVTREN